MQIPSLHSSSSPRGEIVFELHFELVHICGLKSKLSQLAATSPAQVHDCYSCNHKHYKVTGDVHVRYLM